LDSRGTVPLWIAAESKRAPPISSGSSTLIFRDTREDSRSSRNRGKHALIEKLDGRDHSK
jgi:hypothetical protein